LGLPSFVVRCIRRSGITHLGTPLRSWTNRHSYESHGVTPTFVFQVGGQTLIALALAHIPAGLGSILLFLQPILAESFAWVFFGEAISLWQFIGARAMLAEIEASRRSHRK
jgi:hypothetical protein